MPGAGFRYALWEISSSSYFEPVVRYDVSVAGDPTRRNISNLQFGPTFNLGVPDRWFLTFYPSPDINKLRRSDHRPDRPAVPPVRRQDRTSTVIRTRGADHQELPGL